MDVDETGLTEPYQAIVRKGYGSLGYVMVAQSVNGAALSVAPDTATYPATAASTLAAEITPTDIDWKRLYREFLLEHTTIEEAQDAEDEANRYIFAIALRDYDEDGVPELVTLSEGYLDCSRHLLTIHEGRVIQYPIEINGYTDYTCEFSYARKYKDTETDSIAWMVVGDLPTGDTSWLSYYAVYTYQLYPKAPRIKGSGVTLTSKDADFDDVFETYLDEHNIEVTKAKWEERRQYYQNRYVPLTEELVFTPIRIVNRTEARVVPALNTAAMDAVLNGGQPSIQAADYSYANGGLHTGFNNAAAAGSIQPELPDGITPSLKEKLELSDEVTVYSYGFEGEQFADGYHGIFSCEYPVVQLASESASERVNSVVFQNLAAWYIGTYCLGIGEDQYVYEAYSEDFHVSLVGDVLFVMLHDNIGGSGYETMVTLAFNTQNSAELALDGLISDWDTVLNIAAREIWNSDSYQNQNTPYKVSWQEVAQCGADSYWLEQRGDDIILVLWYGSMLISRHPVQHELPSLVYAPCLSSSSEIISCCGLSKAGKQTGTAYNDALPYADYYVSASRDYRNDYPVSHLVDDDNHTAWLLDRSRADYQSVEIAFTLNKPSTVSALAIRNGYWKDAGRYDRYSRAKTFYLTLEALDGRQIGDGITLTAGDLGVGNTQILSFTPVEDVKTVRIRILDYYWGSDKSSRNYQANYIAISELRLISAAQ